VTQPADAANSGAQDRAEEIEESGEYHQRDGWQQQRYCKRSHEQQTGKQSRDEGTDPHEEDACAHEYAEQLTALVLIHPTFPFATSTHMTPQARVL
jgi:hypothetical protein